MSLKFIFVLQVTNIPGVKIFQCCNAITFVNVYYLKRKLLEEVRAFLLCFPFPTCFPPPPQVLSSHPPHLHNPFALSFRLKW